MLPTSLLTPPLSRFPCPIPPNLVVVHGLQARHLISYQKPQKVMEEYGFEVDEVLKLPLSLTGEQPPPLRVRLIPPGVTL